MYNVMNSFCPSTEQGLQALVTKPTGEPQPHRWRQLMPGLLTDPWGNPYQYVLGGKRSKDEYEVFSKGPDGKPGTPDDIGNW